METYEDKIYSQFELIVQQEEAKYYNVLAPYVKSNEEVEKYAKKGIRFIYRIRNYGNDITVIKKKERGYASNK